MSQSPRPPYFYVLDTDANAPFPNVTLAHEDPDGLLAIGGCLSPTRLMNAYRQGIFPWFSPNEPILWWSPSKRAVIASDSVRCNRSLRKFIKQSQYRVTLNRDFPAVIRHCADIPRGPGNGTWITKAMQQAYITLHELGHAHSIEVWQGETLVGGLYGVQVKRTFCGESMFSLAPNASKVALVALGDELQRLSIERIDCQIMNPFLQQMGAQELPRTDFIQALQEQQELEFDHQRWCSRQIPIANVGN
ncbi:MAG: leucyl/phenylalanyl-tRNA--protein transferase [Gammaproteobacteria bacterium]|nr:leucyl/phenylalanyl-tRNA--protein transferase [Gammaproteobacteria bacterium]